MAPSTHQATPSRAGGVAVKFCGLTRAEDAAAAASLGARYLGVIFAGGPRRLTPEGAAAVYAAGTGTCARVGVFGALSAREVAAIARQVGLEVVQLHADPTPAFVDEVRRAFPGEIWAVARTAAAELPALAPALFAAADAVVLDAKVAGALGGSGVALQWDALADAVDRARGGRRLVLAGGLTPDNVGRAIAALAPEVVDVSSGVESAPGVKDHARMAAFAAAAGRTVPAAGS